MLGASGGPGPRVLTLPLPLASELRHPAGAEQPCGESPPLRESPSRHPCGRKCLQIGAGIQMPGGGLVPSLLKPMGSPRDPPVWLLTHPTRSTSPPGDGWKSLVETTPTAEDEATWQNGSFRGGRGLGRAHLAQCTVRRGQGRGGGCSGYLRGKGQQDCPDHFMRARGGTRPCS